MAKKTSDHPTLLSQALAWLDNMRIPYQDKAPEGFYSFEYKGFDIHLTKDCEDNQLGFYGMVFILPEDDDKDESTYTLIYKFAEQFAKDTFLKDGEVEYCSDGLCLVYNWWEMNGSSNKLYKHNFVEMLESIRQLQIDFHLALKGAEQTLFYPPKEVMEEVLRDIDTSDTNFTIEGSVFADCPADYSGKVIIPEGITKIGDKAFMFCDKVTAVILPKSLESIGQAAFHACGISTIDIPSSVTSIGFGAFLTCRNLKRLELPPGLKKIEEALCCGCDNLEEITIPESVTFIGESAFYGCEKLKEIYLPSNLKTIEPQAFQACTSLKEISIPDGCLVIGCGAFRDCTGLTSIELPDSLWSTGDYDESGCACFENCTSLKKIKFPTTMLNIPAYCMEGCTSLTEVILPEKVRTIDSETFKNCKSLTTITLPPSVVEVYEDAFLGCENLRHVKAPVCAVITNTAFRGCPPVTIERYLN